MLIHLPPSLAIDDRLIGVAFAALGIILFIVIFGRRIWSKVKHTVGRSTNTWARAIWPTCAPIISALVLGVLAALIWPHLGIQKDSFQTQIGSVPIQVDGSAGVFAIVYLGALTFLGNRLPREPQPTTPPRVPVRVTRNPKWPDHLHMEDSS